MYLSWFFFHLLFCIIDAIFFFFHRIYQVLCRCENDHDSSPTVDALLCFFFSEGVVLVIFHFFLSIEPEIR